MCELHEFSDAIQVLGEAERDAAWLGDETLNRRIRLTRVRAHLWAGMYEAARPAYPELLQDVKTAVDAEDRFKRVEEIVDTLSYDSSELVEPVYDAMEKMFNGSGDARCLAKVICRRADDALLDDSDANLDALWSSLESVLTDESRDSVFKELADLHKEYASFGSDALELPLNRDVATEIGPWTVNSIENVLGREATVHGAMVRMPFSNVQHLQADLVHADFLVGARVSALGLQAEVDEALGNETAEPDLAAAKGALDHLLGEGALSAEPLRALILRLARASVPANLATDWLAAIGASLGAAIFDEPAVAEPVLSMLLDVSSQYRDPSSAVHALLSVATMHVEAGDSGSADFLDKTEQLIRAHRDELDEEEVLSNCLVNLGTSRCEVGDFGDGLRLLLDAANVAQEAGKYAEVLEIWGELKELPHDVSALDDFLAIEKLAQSLSDKMKSEPPKETYSPEEALSTSVDKEHLARELERAAADNPDRRQAVQLYEQAAHLYEQLEHQRASLRDVYEKSAETLGETADAETTTDSERKGMEALRLAYLEKARAISEDVWDYGRVLDLECEMRELFSDMDDYERWRNSAQASKILCLRNGAVTELQELFEELVPLPEEENDDWGEPEDDADMVPFQLPSEELILIYRESVDFLKAKGLIAACDKFRDRLERYADRTYRFTPP